MTPTLKRVLVLTFLIQGIWCAPLEDSDASKSGAGGTGISITAGGSSSGNAVEDAAADLSAGDRQGGSVGTGGSNGASGSMNVGGRGGSISGSSSRSMGGMGGSVSGSMGGMGGRVSGSIGGLGGRVGGRLGSMGGSMGASMGDMGGSISGSGSRGASMGGMGGRTSGSVGGSMGGMGGGMGGSMSGGTSGSTRQSATNRRGSSSRGSHGNSGTSRRTSNGSIIGVNSFSPFTGSSGSSSGGLMGIMNSVRNIAANGVTSGHNMGQSAMTTAANTMLGAMGVTGGSNAAHQTLSSGLNLGSLIDPQNVMQIMSSPSRMSSSYSTGQSSGQNGDGYDYSSAAFGGIPTYNVNVQGHVPSSTYSYQDTQSGSYTGTENAANVGGISTYNVNMQGQVPSSTYNQATKSVSYGGGNTGSENTVNLVGIPAVSVKMQDQAPSSTYSYQDTSSGTNGGSTSSENTVTLGGIPTYNDNMQGQVPSSYQETNYGSYGGISSQGLLQNPLTGVKSALNLITPQLSISSNTPISSSGSGMSLTIPTSGSLSSTDLSDLSSLESKFNVRINGPMVEFLINDEIVGSMNADQYNDLMKVNNNSPLMTFVYSMAENIVSLTSAGLKFTNLFNHLINPLNLLSSIGSSFTSSGLPTSVLTLQSS